MSDHTIPYFKSGTHSILNPDVIPADAAQQSLGWLTKEGKIILSYGRAITGNDSAVAGKICGLHFGYKIDGSKVMYRKISTKIQYLNGSTWTDIITGLTASSDYSFANYASLAGSFTYIGGIDGIWKIINAFPANPINVTSSVNFKGKILIDRGRMLLWGRSTDPTGLYGSYIDAQNATVYTTVSGEATSSLSGTLAFKAGGATRSCFGVTITLTGTGEVYTDNYLGVLSGSLGGTGTINYATGAYTVTNAGVGTAGYQWEDGNAKGVTDFRHTATRLAGEGFQFPQDQGGDAILNVLIGQDGSYFSEKSQSFYQLTLDSTDLAADNIVYRTDIGVPSFRAGVSTNKGIVFLNTANPSKPEMTILQKSIVTNNIEPVVLFPHFKFANYVYSDCAIDTWERYVIVMCKSEFAQTNDTMLLCDISAGTVDAVLYSARCSAKNNGNLYIGHPLVENVYQLFDGFDDDGISISNYWIGRNEQYQGISGKAIGIRAIISEKLKKYRKQKIKGMIAPSQSIEVYGDPDGSGMQLIGTIVGTGDYVDYSNPTSIGSSMIGQSQQGGDDSGVVAYPFLTELKCKLPKFRSRSIKFIATGIGYAEINMVSDWDILVFEGRLPSRYRQHQNVSLDGLTTNIAQN